MSVIYRNNVHLSGSGPVTMILGHGLGCNQSMWRNLAPAFQRRFRVALFDLVGCGKSDWSAYDPGKYGSLQGYVSDLLELIDAVADQPVVYVGHSVSGIIGMLASVQSPDKFRALTMIGSSPCFLNHGDYQGGFSQADIDELCRTMDNNYLGWASTMAPKFMGAPDHPELTLELVRSFSRTDPEIARQFARVTFNMDERHALAQTKAPTLILQSSDDFIVPSAVGVYMQESMPHGEMETIPNIGHFPHLSAPDASIRAMDRFFARIGL